MSPELATIKIADISNEIYVLFLVVTTDCMFACKYCFVRKNPSYMAWGTAKKAIELLIKTKGKKKLLKIYGGEPLMNFSLIRKIVPYAEKLALEHRKTLTVTICSNMVLFDTENLKFIKNHNISLALSSDGNPRSHNLNRRFKAGKESAGIIEEKLGLLLKRINKEKLAVNLTVPREIVSSLYVNFKYIISLGIDTLNIEPIMTDNWKKEERELFKREYAKILKFIIKNIDKNNFLFITQINRELKYNEVSEMMEGDCILKRNIIVSTNGDLHLNVFAAYSDKYKKEKCVGNVNGAIAGKYFACVNRDSEVCRECLLEYSKNLKKINSPNDIRSSLTLVATRAISENSKKNLAFTKYTKQAKRHICF